MPNTTVFISHISEEAPAAVVLKEQIERDFLGLAAVFVASDSSSIPAGSKWLDRIDQSLRSAKIELVLCSPRSIRQPSYKQKLCLER